MIVSIQYYARCIRLKVLQKMTINKKTTAIAMISVLPFVPVRVVA